MPCSIEQLEETENAERELYQALANKRISVRDFLSAYEQIDRKLVRMGEVFDSAEELRPHLTRCLFANNRYIASRHIYKFISETIQHEEEHAKIAKEYGLSTKFIYIETPSRWSTIAWYYDLPEKAKDWDIDKLIEFFTKQAKTHGFSSLKELDKAITLSSP